MRDQNEVVIYKIDQIKYPELPPFNPSKKYPEYSFNQFDGENNFVYKAVREILGIAGLDKENFGTKFWNPLKKHIKPGDVVLLKPNLIKEKHPRDNNGWQYLMTHGSIIRAVADYVFKALNGGGKIVVADSPQTDSSFARIKNILGLGQIQKFYRERGLQFEIVDLRREEWKNERGVIVDRYKLQGDSEGYIKFDLGRNSEFFNHRGAGHYYGADYDVGEVNNHHQGDRHEYLIAGTAIKCDVFINLPKLKTHKKAGVTINLKNLVGVNGNKNWLPHHTMGSPKEGGDQYPKYSKKRHLERRLIEVLYRIIVKYPKLGIWALAKLRNGGEKFFGDTNRVIRSGNWHGNDTVWRMCLDLNKIVLYGNSDGSLKKNSSTTKKKFLSFVDGIVAGEGNGPMNPDPVSTGVILFGQNPAEVDVVATVLMGFSPDKVPLIRESFKTRGYSITDTDWKKIICISNKEEWSGRLNQIYEANNAFHFQPHFGWQNHIENDY